MWRTLRNMVRSLIRGHPESSLHRWSSFFLQISMSLESIRRQNIERNKKLLESLELDSLTASLSHATKAKTKPKPQRSKKIDEATPLRRSRRLAKDTVRTSAENEAELLERNRLEKENLLQEKLSTQRLSKLNGDFHFSHLRADPHSGFLLAEEDIYGLKAPNSSDSYEQSRLQDSQVVSFNSIQVRKVENVQISSPKTEVRSPNRSKTNIVDLHIDTGFDFQKYKLTPRRISSLLFHPSVSDRLTLAGDSTGCLGIWPLDHTVDSTPNMVLLRPHGRGITKISDVPYKFDQVITASHDGSCRIVDLTKEKILETAFISDELGYAVGITDVVCPSPNMLYLTTSSGYFLKHDTRQQQKNVDCKSLISLHEKKIGGFCVNPSCDNQIATASLDKSMKVWDLRQDYKPRSYSNSTSRSFPTCYAEFKSRLSISSVDWNNFNQLVCNGYDDRVRLFSIAEGMKRPTRYNTQGPSKHEILTPQKEIKHNCQTGRWVSILKSRWQRSPRDGIQKFAIGNMNRSIDIYSAIGDKLANLSAPEIMTAVPAVIALHPSENWILGGTSSGRIFLFS